MIAIRALKGAGFALNNGTLKLVEATRRLTELKEPGLPFNIAQIIEQTQPKEGGPRARFVVSPVAAKLEG